MGEKKAHNEKAEGVERDELARFRTAWQIISRAESASSTQTADSLKLIFALNGNDARSESENHPGIRPTP